MWTKLQWGIAAPFVLLGATIGFCWYNFYYGFIGGKLAVDDLCDEMAKRKHKC